VNAEHAGSSKPTPRRWAPGPDVIVRRTGDTAVIVDLRTNKIFELNAVASRVWDLLTETADEPTLLSRIRDEFDVDPDQLHRDVQELLADLQRENLISRA
jgi:ATP-dependent protease HslVU (ClpYQ) peptidase subunit